MHPKLFSIPLPDFLSRLLGVSSITVYTYAFCIVLGTVIACLYIKRGARKELNGVLISHSFFYSVFLVGFVGGKLFCYLEAPMVYLQDPDLLLHVFSGGFVCYGSVLFIIMFVIWYARKQQLNIYGFLDIVATAAVIPQITGRLGCFFAGCCYGKPTHGDWGVLFPNAATHVHPTQLYETGLMSMVFICLLLATRYKKFNGQVFLLYVFAYSAIRFSLEFIRGDFRGMLFNGMLSHSQVIAIAALLISPLLFIRLKCTLNKPENKQTP